MTTRDDIVSEALTWIGTPFHANQRTKQVGADCVGVIAGIFEACGVVVSYRNDYSLRPDGSLCTELEQRMARVNDRSLVAGDVLLMAFDSEAHHVALYVGDGAIVHTYTQARRCVRNRYDAYWQSLTRAVYRHPALTP